MVDRDTYPYKVNLAGVIPIIFAMSFVALPQLSIILAPNATGFWFIKNIQQKLKYLYYQVFSNVLHFSCVYPVQSY